MASPVLVNGLSGVQATPIYVRGTECNIEGYHIYNPSNAAAFVSFYDSLVAPTVGTTVPVWCGVLPTLTNSSHDFAQAAGQVPGVSDVRCFISAVVDRNVSGQVQGVVTTTTGPTTIAAPLSGSNSP